MSIAYPPVEELLPHRGRALLLARVVDWTEQQVCCEAILGEECPYVRDGRLESVCGLEVLAQAAGVYLGLARRAGGATGTALVLGDGASDRVSGDRASGYLVGVPHADLHVETLPVDRPLRAQVSPLWQEGGAARFRGVLHHDDTVLLSAELSLFVPQPAEAQ